MCCVQKTIHQKLKLTTSKIAQTWANSKYKIAIEPFTLDVLK